MKTNQATTTRYSVASQMAFDVLIDALDIVVDEPSLSQQGHGLGSDGPQICLITAKGQTGFAQTSTRLLGFSSELRRWTDVQLGAEERVERHQVLPRLAVVQTSRGLYVTKKHGVIGRTNRSARMSTPSKCMAAVTLWSSSPPNGCWSSLPSLEDSFRCLGRPTNASSQLTIQTMR